MLRRGVDALVRPLVTPALDPLLAPVREHVLRVCPVPDDLAAVTTVGDEDVVAADADDVAALWARAEGLYRSGVDPAIQLCVRHRGRVVLDRAIGHSHGVYPHPPLDPDLAVRVTPDTPINLFSAGKAVTAMLVHLLEHRGAVDLDERVAHYLPGFGANGKDAVTLRQVLTHRGGVPSLPPAVLDLDALGDHEQVEAHVCGLELSAAVGDAPSYHALTGGFVMECVARRTTGESLRDLLRRDVKEPLGLQWFDLGVDPAHTDRVATNVCTGLPLAPPLSWMFDRLLGMGWDEAVRISNDPRFQSGVIPSGNVIATAADTAAFYQCLLDGADAEVAPFHPATIERAVATDRAGLELDQRLLLPLRYSAGFMLGTDTISPYGWNHPEAFGHLGLSNSFTWADPERDLVVALLTTGKAVLGTHVPALLQLITEIHRRFPADG